MTTIDTVILPTGWVTKSLITLVALNPRGWDTELADEDTVSFVPMSTVEAATGKLDASLVRSWKEVRKGYTTFQEGDVLFAKITPCMENGKFALATGLAGGRGAGSTEFHVLRPTAAIHPTLLLHFLLQRSVRFQARAEMKGAAGQLRVPSRFFQDLSFPLPPLPEQHRIVAAIEQQFTRLDAAVADLRRARAKLKRYRAAVLAAACSGRLVPTEAELARAEGREFESGTVLLRQVLLTHSSAGEMAHRATKDSSTVAEGWTEASLGSVATLVTKGTTPTTHGHSYKSSGIAFVRVENLSNGYIDNSSVSVFIDEAADELLKRSRLHSGDLLFSIAGTIGRTAMVRDGDLPANTNQALAIIRGTSEVFVTKFLQIALASSQGQEQARVDARGGAMSNVSLGDVKAIRLPVPPIAEQHRIVAEVERRLSVVDEMENTVAANLKRAERMRQAILHHAFAGRLVPQDPSDAPVSEVLQLIREEGAASVPATKARGRTEEPRRESERRDSGLPLFADPQPGL